VDYTLRQKSEILSKKLLKPKGLGVWLMWINCLARTRTSVQAPILQKEKIPYLKQQKNYTGWNKWQISTAKDKSNELEPIYTIPKKAHSDKKNKRNPCELCGKCQCGKCQSV
jgi:hypothetical protein